MLFTRTIRRKMVFFLALVLVMLVTLSLGGISGLASYRNAVRDLDFSINNCPRRSDVALAVGELFNPFRELDPAQVPEPGQAAAMEFQRKEFAQHLAHAREEIIAYRRKLDVLPPADVTSQRVIAESLLYRIDIGLKHLADQEAALSRPEERSVAVAAIHAELNALLPVIADLPDYQHGLNRTLRNAREAYRAYFLLVCITGALSLGLFLGLMRYGYIGIFQPLRRLHQGALRVAQGDFDYRVTIASRDEMAELAESFNKMTARFKEITADLDRQVRERSKQLVRSERLAGVGFLAAGVAHEINNPLSAMAMAAESLEHRLSGVLAELPEAERTVILRYLHMMQSEAERCRNITARLLDFSRGQEATARHNTDLTGIVREVLSMVQHMSKYRDRQVRFARTEACFAEVNGAEIKQVVLNLVANSLESMEPRKTLYVDISEQVDQVVISFRDEGCGMTPEVLDNLFEPFFTQRKDGKGTGLGLSISQRIIGDHGGTIEAHSDGPNLGSTFLVHLPRKAAARAAA